MLCQIDNQTIENNEPPGMMNESFSFSNIGPVK